MTSSNVSFDTLLSAIDYIESVDESPHPLKLSKGTSPEQRVLRNRTILKSKNNSLEVSGEKRTRRKRRTQCEMLEDKENVLNIHSRPKRLKKSTTWVNDVENNENDREQSQTSTKSIVIDREKEKEVGNFLNECMQKAELSRKSDVERTEPNTSIYEPDLSVISPCLKHLPDNLDIAPVSPVSLFEESREITLVVYNNEETSVQQPIETDNVIPLLLPALPPSSSLTSTPPAQILKKNPMNVTLDLSCHSDTSYDLAMCSPFTDLCEELDENNNLVLSHPKLKSFIVTSNLNVKFGLSNNIHSESSELILQDLNKLKDNGCMDFNRMLSTSSTPCKDNYNWQLFSKMFLADKAEADEKVHNLSLTGVREADICMENFTSPLLVIEQEAEKLQASAEKKRAAKRVREEKAAEEESLRVKAAKIKEESQKVFKKTARANQSEDAELEYAFEKSQEIFTLAELKNGIFCALNKNGVNINRSKVRTALSQDKVFILKEKIGHKFKLKGQELEDAWFYLRTDLNKQLSTQFQGGKKRKN